jgi:hypothetical protein
MPNLRWGIRRPQHQRGHADHADHPAPSAEPAATAGAALPKQRHRPTTARRRPHTRNGRRLIQAAVFAAVRGAAYALGAAAGAWLIYWLTRL